MPIIDVVGGDLAALSNYPVSNASTLAGEDLVDAIIAELESSPELLAAVGGTIYAFEAGDRRLSRSPFPYVVLVNVAGRYRNFTGRGDATNELFYDLHWVDPSSVKARRLVRLSVKRLLQAARSGRLDTAEGRVKSLLPSSEKAHVDPDRPVGVGGELSVVNAFVQLQFLLATDLSTP